MSAEEDLSRWRCNPAVMVWDLFGATPDTWQAEALRAYSSAPISRVSMRACAGPGKSTVLAWCIVNHMLTQAGVGDHPVGAAISITADNLRDNLWAELARWHGRSELLRAQFTHSAELYFQNENKKTWFISARSFARSANAEEQGRTLSGLHARRILYAIDEAGDISPSVLNAAEQGLSTCEVGKILVAGNPTSMSGLLYQTAVHLRDRWHVIRITADPADPNRSPRVSLEWAQQQIDTYGRDNAWVQAYVLGEFPPGGINSLLSVDQVEASMRSRPADEDYRHSQRRLGVDVARFGDDRTVIFPRQGLVAFEPVTMRDARGHDIAARIMLAKEKWQSEVEFVDGSGVGASVLDSLLQSGNPGIAVAFAGRPDDPRYLNKRSEMWFRMKDWIERSGSLPRVDGLVRELTEPTYTFTHGKYHLEEKDQIKRRLGYSPDLADALACTFCWSERPGGDAIGQMRAQRTGRVLSDFDPLAVKM